MKTKYDVSSVNGGAAKDQKSSMSGDGEVSAFRTVLPQILASTAKNLLLIDLGLAVAFPTIVIPALRGLQKERNPDEFLYFTAEQASWFGSIAFICQPIGSVLSGWVSEPIGRKRAMILVNIPHIIAWLMLYFASTLEEIFVASVLLGLGVGFMEAPIVTYVATLGFFVVYLLGSITDWRTVALCCLALPLTTVVAICFVPETPLWLLSKDRKPEALKSLQWLRGWVPPNVVEKEFNEMQRYSESSNSCIVCSKADIKCLHPAPTTTERLKELLRKRTIKPFLLVITLFAVSLFSGLAAMRPYMVQIMKAYGTPIDANWGTVVIGLMGFIANIVCMCVVRVVGKRKLALFSLAGTSMSCISIGFYAYNTFPPGWSSFENHESMEVVGQQNYFPMIMFFALSFFTSVGVSSIPWMLLSEVFPFKSRGFATGITAAMNYLMTFIAIKTYLNFERWLSLYGVIWMYGAIGALGIIVIYFILPETENQSLEDIELHFSDNNRKMHNIKIIKTQKVQDSGLENGFKAVQLSPENHATVEQTTENGKRLPSTGCDNKAFA